MKNGISKAKILYIDRSSQIARVMIGDMTKNN